MEPDGFTVEVLPPESTITTLFSNSGHLKSSLVPDLNRSIRYNEKEYDSASTVLNAIIADFQCSGQNSESCTGSLLLPKTPSSTPTKLSRHTPRRQDVLKERLTTTELDFLNLPVSSLHHRSNRDRLSMTTDELLFIPLEGSMPVTHTSAFIEGLSRSRVDHTENSGHSVLEGYRRKGEAEAATAQSNHSKHHSPKTPHTVSELERSSALHLQQWLSSQKEEVYSSNVTSQSMPNLKCPPWLQQHKLKKQQLESDFWEETPSSRMSRTAMGEASWVMHPDEFDSVNQRAMAQHQQTLKDLRLSLAEQIYLLATEKESSDVKESLLRGNKLERLIDKADRVLNTLTQTSGFAAPGWIDEFSNSNTEKEINNCGSRVVDSHVDVSDNLHCFSTLEAAVAAAAHVVPQTDSDTWECADGKRCQGDGCGNRKQPGPLEALKQVMFRIQAVEAQLERQNLTSAASDRPSPRQKKGQSKAAMKRLDEGPILQSTLRDLSQLKLREVKPKLKPGNKEEENDPDEGHFSSLSTDGFA